MAGIEYQDYMASLEARALFITYKNALQGVVAQAPFGQAAHGEIVIAPQVVRDDVEGVLIGDAMPRVGDDHHIFRLHFPGKLLQGLFNALARGALVEQPGHPDSFFLEGKIGGERFSQRLGVAHGEVKGEAGKGVPVDPYAEYVGLGLPCNGRGPLDGEEGIQAFHVVSVKGVC